MNQRTGRTGEAHAASYLQSMGYEVIGRNLRISGCEIDILAMCEQCLVVVEVKTRLSSAFGTPLEQIDRRKLRRLEIAARALSTQWGGRPVQIDVVGIQARGVDGETLVQPTLVHLTNVTG